MIHLPCSAVAICAAATALVASNVMSQEPAEPITVSWRLIGNQPEGGFQAELTLRNNAEDAMPRDWAMYFNSAARLLPESLPAELILSHINGDFWVLRPKSDFSPIQPGESRSIAYAGRPWAINVSDAPSGFYLVLGEQSGRASVPIPAPVHVEPFPAAPNLKRGADDAVSCVTGETRYSENAYLSLLPPEQFNKVVPTPVVLQPLAGKVVLGRRTLIFCDAALNGEAGFLAAALEPLLGARPFIELGIPIDRPFAGNVRLRIGPAEVAGSLAHEGGEAYTLAATPEGGIEIVGSDAAGVFYGIQTLRTLLPIESYRNASEVLVLDAVGIADAPRFGYRGLHLDVARNFQSKETVEKLLDLMAFYKLNRFHWHLTDDEGWRIEIKALPELTEVGGHRGHTHDESDHLVPSHGSGPTADAAVSPGSGFYTQEDFVEVLKYARLRHISVIPELDFPGHARAAIKSMEARGAGEFLLREPGDASQYESVQMWRDNVVDVGREATYRFLGVVVGELADMYQRAGVPLASIHLGGDEVPKGAWEKSQACERIVTDSNSKIPRSGQLELHFLDRAAEILGQHAIQPACWEDCLLLEVDEDAEAGRKQRAAAKGAPTAYVWNNVWGWGREDAAYRLANAGFDVVLCNATNLYFDLACEKDPLEPGYYWAGFVGMRAAYEFVPLDIFKDAERNALGQPVNEQDLASRARLTADGAQHILGIQGQLWSENLRDTAAVEYMAFPRVIALAERAWAQEPAWAKLDDREERRRQLAQDWNQFANRLGQRELPRLDHLFGGVAYRLPPPGAVLRDGKIMANVEFPGLVIRYTADGSDPTADDEVYRSPIPVAGNQRVQLKTFDTRGRGSRSASAEQEP